MISKESFTKVTPLSKFIALLLFIALPFIGFYVGWNYKNTIAELYNRCIHIVDSKTPVTPTPQNKPEDDFLKPRAFTGTIKKEKIPTELELGDTWYWFYFDEPHLLEYNAAGRPMYITKIQVSEPKDKFYNLEDYTDIHVQIIGTYGWGYAESTVFDIHTITRL